MRFISLALVSFISSLLVVHGVVEASDRVPLRAKQKYTITVLGGKNGTVSPSKSSTVVAGASKTFRVAPKPGFLIDALSVNGAPPKNLPKKTGESFTLVLKNIRENLTIKASFAKQRSIKALPVGDQLSVVDAKK